MAISNAMKTLSLTTAGAALVTLNIASNAPVAQAAVITGSLTGIVERNLSEADLSFPGLDVGDTFSGIFSFEDSDVPTSGSFNQPLLSFELTETSPALPAIGDIDLSASFALFEGGSFQGILVSIPFPEESIGSLGINGDSFVASSRGPIGAAGSVTYSLNPPKSVPEPTTIAGLAIFGLGFLAKKKLSSAA